jgi:heme/copper-type cytochrome/quinol oxidase subunit 2
MLLSRATKEPKKMTIALNILLAVIVFAGVVGMLAYSIIAARTPAQPKVHTETAKARAAGRARGHGSFKTVNA